VKGKDEHSDEEDLLKLRPNPDMMDTKPGPDGQVMLFTSLLILCTCYIAKRDARCFLLCMLEPPTRTLLCERTILINNLSALTRLEHISLF